LKLIKIYLQCLLKHFFTPDITSPYLAGIYRCVIYVLFAAVDICTDFFSFSHHLYCIQGPIQELSGLTRLSIRCMHLVFLHIYRVERKIIN